LGTDASHPCLELADIRNPIERNAMNKSKNRTMFNKLIAVIATTVMATAGLAMVSAPANAGATSTPILVTYDAGGSSGTGYVNPASNGAADAGSVTNLVTNDSPTAGTGNFGSVAKCNLGCDYYGMYGGAQIWNNTGGGAIANFSLMPTGAGTSGTTVSLRIYASTAQVGKTAQIRLAWGDPAQGQAVESSAATLSSGWNSYTLTIAADLNASHRYYNAYLHFDGYNNVYHNPSGDGTTWVPKAAD
jgi:hypothetical protein